jgi:hypothetical protein
MLLALAGPLQLRAAEQLVVRGTGTELGETPVIAELANAHAQGAYALKDVATGRKAGCAQIFPDRGKTVIAAVLERVPKEGQLTLEFAHDPALRGITFESGGMADLVINQAGRPLTEYHSRGQVKPYLFPVIGPTGAPFTRAFPMKDVAGEDRDHPHQRSFWFTHGKLNGIDFWSEEKGHGSIRETDRLTRVEGPALGLLRTKNEWLSPDGKKICEDERTYRFFNMSTSRIIDFDITLEATDGPLTFGDTKEGMFGVRVASSMDVKRKEGGKITNAEGITDAAAWGKPSPWVDYTGPVEGETVGVAILNHPESFRYPTTWHVRDYGLFAANPFGWHDFGLGKSGEHTVPAGESITFRYRVILHKGDTASAGLPAAFRAYASPPAIALK